MSKNRAKAFVVIGLILYASYKGDDLAVGMGFLVLSMCVLVDVKGGKDD